MRLYEFSTRGWRNLQARSLNPCAGLNVIHGRNGQGKTNLLEAIYYVATLRSFRSTRPSQLVSWGLDGFHLEARVEVGGRMTRFSVRFGGEGRKLLVDGTGVDSVDEYFGGFNVVLFTPEHLGLVRGEPTLRRQFLDRALFNVDVSQLGMVRRYQRVLRERNSCLKRYGEEPRVAEALLDALDPQLSELGAELAMRRLQLVAELEPRFAAIHQEIAGDLKVVRLKYLTRGLKWKWQGQQEGVEPEEKEEKSVLSQEQDEERDCLHEGAPLSEERAQTYRLALGRALEAGRSRDLRRGFTGVGPHQDDLVLSLEGRMARLTASQGEARSLVLALKLAEVDYLHERRREPPVLLLDDLGSELDRERQQSLLAHILDLRCQTFVTTVLPESEWTFGEKQYFQVDTGTIVSP